MSTMATRWLRSRSRSATRASRRCTSSAGCCCLAGGEIWSGWSVSILGGLVRVEFLAVETDDLVAPRLLGDVQRIVGRAHEVITLLDLRMGPARDAKAGRALEGPSGERECMGLEPFPHPLRECDGGVKHGSGQEEHELLAAVPPNAIDLARLVLQDVGELFQHFVTGLVTVSVVDAFELVQVAHDERERLAQPLRVREHLVDALVEVATIVEPR